MADYLFLRAFHEIMPYYKYFITGHLRMARRSNAPEDAVFPIADRKWMLIEKLKENLQKSIVQKAEEIKVRIKKEGDPYDEIR